MKTKTLTGTFAIVICGGRLQAQTRDAEFVPFERFLEHTRTVSSIMSIRPDARVRNSSAFEQMRQHIVNLYRDVHVTHSFVMNLDHFDCIPMQQQPAARLLGPKGGASVPPLSRAGNRPIEVPAEGPTTRLSQETAVETKDAFGNSLHCEAGTIPMRRITLDEMTRFPSLRDFFDKGPNKSGQAPQADSQNSAAAEQFSDHKYAYMEQTVNNIGGNSNLNIWSPYVNTDLGEVFSLSQEWYTAGSGASRQTAEVGWQNFPGKYGDERSRLFIYYTANNYQGQNCYNMECAAFYQVSNNWVFGGSFPKYSSVGGPQYDVSASFYLYNGDWWLSINGEWVGYYPGALYNGGPLAQHADKIQFGTESYGTEGVWPAEGSGDWGNANWMKSAYQNNLFYYDTDGTAYWDTLTPNNPSPKCYSTFGPFTDSTSGSVYFYAGGPGGSGC